MSLHTAKLSGLLRLSSVSLQATMPAACISTSSVALNRPNLRRPRIPCFQREKILDLSKPVYPERHPTTEHIWRECPKHREDSFKRTELKEPNAFELLYAEELREKFNESKMVAFFHANTFPTRVRHKAWQNARRSKMDLCTYNRRIAAAVCAGTELENLLHFWTTCRTPTYLVFSKEIQAGKLIKYDKKVPEMFLMGALVENRILNKKQLQDLSNMPPIEYLHGELSSILQTPARKTLSMLEANPQALSMNLDQYVKDQKEKK